MLFGTLCTVYLEQLACLLEGHIIKTDSYFTVGVKLLFKYLF